MAQGWLYPTLPAIYRPYIIATIIYSLLAPSSVVCSYQAQIKPNMSTTLQRDSYNAARTTAAPTTAEVELDMLSKILNLKGPIKAKSTKFPTFNSKPHLQKGR
ncbi:hypothetical protein B0H34DRAFT_671693 [Crassisporium funariophilum]|nr:hypothetical protein B0H34DRAFT_671693 [Crassisporium funariophilum]